MSSSRCSTGLAALMLAMLACFVACTGTQTRNAPDAPRTQGSDAPPADAPNWSKQAGPSLMLKGGRVMTANGVIYETGDVLVKDGRIVEVGKGLTAPKGVEVVNAAGMTITPGLIDTHSHMGVYAAPGLTAHADGNEVVGPVTAYVRAEDGYWPQDPQFDTARAGGVTTAQILPGSANLIGGRTFTVKLHPKARSVDDARFPGAPEGLKMACGENPKRVYGDKGGPDTRMGNVAGYRKAFQEAVEYGEKWKRYRDKLAKWEAKQGRRRDTPNLKDPFDRRGVDRRDAATRTKGREHDGDTGDGDDDDDDGGPPDPPARDYGLETLSKVIDGEILVHNHCYRADEMSLMLRLADSFGFKIRSFHHAVEAYKIADRLAAAGTGASVWADWWGFKAEAYDGVRENAAMISKAGAKAIIHSDSAEGIQRLNQEAAKAMFAGRRVGIDITENEALRWITMNPAWALGIDEQVGSIEAGKMADLVVWDKSPFSVYAKAQKVFIDGHLVFDREDSEHQPQTDFGVGLREGVGGAR